MRGSFLASVESSGVDEQDAPLERVDVKLTVSVVAVSWSSDFLM